MINFTTVGVMNYNVLRNIIFQGNVLRLNRGAEVGVLNGDTSYYMLAEFPQLTLFSIDPYQQYKDDAEGRAQNQLSECEAKARAKLSRFGERSVMIKKFSAEAAHDIPDQSLDFVFIDANHLYESVKEDIATWYPKVRREGIFSGHDFRSFPGVTRAVNEFSESHKLDGFHSPMESDIWFFVKP